MSTEIRWDACSSFQQLPTNILRRSVVVVGTDSSPMIGLSIGFRVGKPLERNARLAFLKLKRRPNTDVPLRLKKPRDSLARSDCSSSSIRSARHGLSYLPTTSDCCAFVNLDSGRAHGTRRLATQSVKLDMATIKWQIELLLKFDPQSVGQAFQKAGGSLSAQVPDKGGCCCEEGEAGAR